MKNFLLLKNGMYVFDKMSLSQDFLNYLASGKFCQKRRAVYDDRLKIMAVSENDYLGYTPSRTKFANDLLFTRTFLKQLPDFLTPSLIHVLCDISANEFTHAKRFREVGNMKSVLVPGSHQQKVLQFCPASLPNSDRQAYILTDIGDADNWNSHRQSLSHKNDFRKKASNQQQYYKATYAESITWVS